MPCGCVLLLVAIVCLQSRFRQVNAQGECSDQGNCNDCIAVKPACAWCTTPGYNSTRCFDYEVNKGNSSCAEDDIYFPKNLIQVDKNEDVHDGDGDQGTDPIQLQPQEITLTLRPGVPTTFNVTFRMADNYPVDLYFLVDNTHTMEQYKSLIASISQELSERMHQITPNFRLGFGTFVDKPTVPFTTDRWTECDDSLEKQCTYGFKNELKLTSNSTEFADVVNRSKSSHNLDAPEGGFDALMQVVVCGEKIGWRNKSRKIVLYASDGMFHIAGDGRLAGIVRPNDAKCHLDDTGLYTGSLELDYPSVSHLAWTIKKKGFNVILAVTPKMKAPYEELKKVLSGSRLGSLDSDGNLLQLILKNYEDIRDTAALREDDRIMGMEEAEISPEYHNVSIGTPVRFEVTVGIDRCLPGGGQYVIHPEALDDKLLVNVRTSCPCTCEDDAVPNSPHCNYNGTLKCGQCECNERYSGARCECDTGGASQQEKQKECIRPGNGTRGGICEERGRCDCGKCICGMIPKFEDPAKKYTGTHCECDNYSCPKANEQMCNGTGVCECGKCKCNDGWDHAPGKDTCTCPVGSISDDKCKESNDSKVCSGHGECRCGKCHCDKSDRINYSGEFCEKCPICPHCEMHKECAQCVISKAGRRSCPDDCVTTHEQETLPDDIEDTEPCKTIDDNDCFFYYIYDDRIGELFVKKKKDCREQTSSMMIIVYVVSSVVGSGILMLFVWRIATYFIDKREMAKFDKDKANAVWEKSDNPLFLSPTTTMNPSFGVQPDLKPE